MSEMNYLDKLLDGVAVEWIEVGELISPQRGRRLVKSQLQEVGSYAVYQNSMKPLGYYHESNAQAGATFVIVAGAAGEIGFSDVAFWAADDVYFFPDSNSVNNKYLYHFLLTKQHEISSQVRRVSIPRLSIAVVERLEIPIPCPENPKKSLEIQAEIVRILDAFTALTAELTAELTARKKQYNYYRDQLLSFEGGEGVTPMTIGDIYDFKYGKGNTIPTEGGKYPVYGSNGIVGTHHEYNSEDSPVIGHIGAYAGIVNWGKGKHFVTYNGVICKHKSKEVLPQFAYYILLAQDFGSKAKNSSQPFVSYDTLKEPIVLIPSLKEQVRIVAILDKFDALTNSITEGLPREIELRQKQYEHYRNLLLGFPKDHPALTGTPPEEGNVFGVSVAENRSAPVFPSSGGVPEGRGGSL